jgi:uncharacterized metal-binding protein YceD (DUF177 family)
MSWARPVHLGELSRGPVRLSLAPDEAELAWIARDLGLVGLPSFTADVEVAPWLDGAVLKGRLRAVVIQTCGVSLEPFEQPIEAEFEVRVLPAGSANLPQEASGELTLDLDAPDPPDELEGDAIDVGGYVVEHLALSLDPFPRKPGVEFGYVDEKADQASPFAVLKGLKDRKDG